MALYCKLHTAFWRETTDEDFSANEKYLYNYLITNDSTTTCGIYKITPKTIAWETGLSDPALKKALSQLQHRQKIFYDKKTNEVILLRHIPYESKSPAWKTATKRTLEKVRSAKILSLRQQMENGGIATVTPEKIEKPSKDKPVKKAYGEYKNVFLSDEGIEELLVRYGKAGRAACVQKLSSWKEAKGRAYKNDFAAIGDWVADSIEAKRIDGESGEIRALICPVCGTNGAGISTVECAKCSFPKDQFSDLEAADEHKVMMIDAGHGGRLGLDGGSHDPDADNAVSEPIESVPLEE